MKTKHNLNNRFELIKQNINLTDLFSKEDLVNVKDLKISIGKKFASFKEEEHLRKLYDEFSSIKSISNAIIESSNSGELESFFSSDFNDVLELYGANRLKWKIESKSSTLKSKLSLAFGKLVFGSLHSCDDYTSFHERLIQISDEFKKSNSSQFSDVVSEIDEIIDKLSRNDFDVKVTPNFLLHNQYMYEVTTFDFSEKKLNKEKPRSEYRRSRNG